MTTLLLAFALQSNDLARYVYPLAKPVACPTVVVDASAFTQGEKWGEAAKSLVENWFSHVARLLATDGVDPMTGEKTGEAYKVPQQLTLVIKPDLSVPAYTSGSTITISGKWITDHPDDLGMVIHEMTHVIQHYPGGHDRPGWLVEGIADYIRWWRYEPELHATSGRTKPNKETANYNDSYRTTAVWLAWCTKRYDRRLVPALDFAMRKGEDPVPLFQKITGKTPDELWQQFIAEFN